MYVQERLPYWRIRTTHANAEKKQKRTPNRQNTASIHHTNKNTVQIVTTQLEHSQHKQKRTTKSHNTSRVLIIRRKTHRKEPQRNRSIHDTNRNTLQIVTTQRMYSQHEWNHTRVHQ